MELFNLDIFRFFNFFLIIVFFVYVLKKYILPNITLIVDDATSRKKKLLAKQHLLEDSLFLLRNNIDFEKIVHERLKENVIRWKNVVAQKHSDNDINRQLLYEHLATKCQIQEQNRTLDIALRKELHNITTTFVETLLKTHFDEKTQDILLQKILLHMSDCNKFKR